jgi:hypothetical protein
MELLSLPMATTSVLALVVVGAVDSSNSRERFCASEVGF